MKQETLEEFIESYVNKIDRSEDGLVEQCLKDAIKWQQERSSSEEDLKEAFTEGHNSARIKGSYKINGTFEEDWNEWFEQFKKK
ncbi:hypothetical protein UFOVP54_205 [uncultured Caudovirales phage]|uniref:Uncharacterized protein n=1 Tax=uncultured Caudovirales phage TaxID=2100421 RepID=A0A6J5KWK0_9CAUD|nr:hypothetical protein UFOVP54_205 [uncultured Caudovirales phage]